MIFSTTLYTFLYTFTVFSIFLKHMFAKYCQAGSLNESMCTGKHTLVIWERITSILEKDP